MRRASIALVGLAITLPLLLVVLTPVPPLLDYPNHLARLWLLAGGAERSSLAPYYAADWSNAFTNTGMDRLAVMLAPIIGGAENAARVMIALALLLPPLGAALLNRSLFGRWHPWQAAFPLFAFNTILIAGFISLMMGVGIAFLAAAAEVRLARHGRVFRLLTRAAFSILALWMHAMALGLYAALVAGIAMGQSPGTLWTDRRRLTTTTLRVLVAVITVVAPAVLALLLSGAPGPWDQAGDDTPLLEAWAGYSFLNKVYVIFGAVSTYDVPLDLIPFAFGMVVIWWSATRKTLRYHGGLLVIAGVLLMLSILMPSNFGGTGWMERRFPIMALMACAAALRPDLPGIRPSVLAACLALLCIVRTTWIGSVWMSRQADVASVERALASVPPGATLLPAFEVPALRWDAPAGRYFPRGQFPAYGHLPSLAVVRRDAFVPTLFALRGRHTLAVRPPWAELEMPQGSGAPANRLDDADMAAVLPFLRDWRARFDYLLVIDDVRRPSDAPVLPAPGLTLLSDEGFARVYRIDRRDPGS